MQHLDIVFRKLGDANLALNLEKCEFGKSQIKFLWHIISADGVNTGPEKIQAITEFPNPTKAKDIRVFPGLTGYFHRFTPDYSKTVEPLLELLSKNTKWRWEEQHEAAFNATKELYSKNLHVFHPGKEGKYVLNCDASDLSLIHILLPVFY